MTKKSPTSLRELRLLNWAAVLGASFAWFALGGLWYSPLLFGPLWQDLTGPSVLHQQPSAPMFIVPFVGSLVGMTATAALVRALGLTTPRQGALLGLGLALALVVPTVAIDAAAPNHPAPLTWTLVVGGYHVFGLVLVALVVTRFRGTTSAA